MKEPKIWTTGEIDGKLCECYCVINEDYRRCHSKKSYGITIGDNEKMIITPVRNPDYDPNIRMPVKPSYCKRKPTPRCHKNNCPHFAFVECD